MFYFVVSRYMFIYNIKKFALYSGEILNVLVTIVFYDRFQQLYMFLREIKKELLREQKWKREKREKNFFLKFLTFEVKKSKCL